MILKSFLYFCGLFWKSLWYFAIPSDALHFLNSLTFSVKQIRNFLKMDRKALANLETLLWTSTVFRAKLLFHCHPWACLWQLEQSLICTVAFVFNSAVSSTKFASLKAKTTRFYATFNVQKCHFVDVKWLKYRNIIHLY